MILRLLFLTSCFAVMTIGTSAQSCFNSNFEEGDAGAYSTFTGVLEAGIPIIDQIEFDTNRHRIMRVDEGLDPVVSGRCIDLELPMVSPSGGAYSMRLGNANTGSQAESVELRFTVDEQSTFFLLQYAVVMEDPNHSYDDQPRFELNISRASGEPVDCGRYVVRAERELEGFVSCGDLRVRPWTTVGIELQSYLGEEIIIEILTTDCGLGGHFGYSYFDATCQPLTIEVVGYCADSDSAIVQVTEGFVEYLWESGDTTSTYVDHDPQQGDTYQVTVTSATGCTLVLSDTLPPLEEVLDPVFSGPYDSLYCGDVDNFRFRPIVSNGERIYSFYHGYFGQSFPINLDLDTSYQFYAVNGYGCISDTVTYTFETNSPEPEFIITPPYCRGDATGTIEIIQNPLESPYTVAWESGDTSMVRSDLEPGIYTVVIAKDSNCAAVYHIEIPPGDGFDVDYKYSIGVCGEMPTGFIEGVVEQGATPYQFSINGMPYTSNNRFTNLPPGIHTMRARDGTGCVLYDTLEIVSWDSPEFLNVEHNFSGCDTFVTIVPVVDFADRVAVVYGPRIDSSHVVNTTWYDQVIVEAIYQRCATRDTFYFDHLGPDISPMLTSPQCHGESTGQIILMDNDGDPLLEYLWEDSSTGSGLIDIPADIYSVTMTNAAACTAVTHIVLTEPDSLQLDIFLSPAVLCEGDSSGRVSTNRRGGVWPYEYSLDGIDYQNNVPADLTAGPVTLYIRDMNGCVDAAHDTIQELLLPLYVGDTLVELCTEVELYRPPYEHVDRVYSVYHESYGLEFEIDLDLETVYQFVGLNELDCPGDTSTIRFSLRDSARVNIEITNNLCHQDSLGAVSLSPVDSAQVYSYEWSNGDDSSTVSGLSMGMYVVSVSDQIGCVYPYDITIYAPPELMSSVALDSGWVCQGDSTGVIHITADGGVGNYGYELIGRSGRDTIYEFSNLAAGSYDYLVVDSNHCSVYGEFEIGSIVLDSVLIDTDPTTCDQDNGSLQILSVAGGLGRLQYSLDTSEYSYDREMYDLAAGDYALMVRDSLGCFTTLDINISSTTPVRIEGESLEHTTCDQANGMIKLAINGDYELSYYIDGLEVNAETLSALSADTYLITVVDSNLCRDSVSFSINPSTALQLTSLDVDPYPCVSQSADVVVGSNRFDELVWYQLDDRPVQTVPAFLSVSEGVHVLTATDGDSCTLSEEFAVSLPEQLSVTPLIDMARCNQAGAITLIATGGVEPYSYSMDTLSWNAMETFNNIYAGVHSLYTRDASDCLTLVEVDMPWDCDIYMPNVFSPNGDGINDRLQPGPESDMGISVVNHQIYDRWGNQVFSSAGGRIDDISMWWDGMVKNQEAPSGVYVYRLDLIVDNGGVISLSGDITLLR